MKTFCKICKEWEELKMCIFDLEVCVSCLDFDVTTKCPVCDKDVCGACKDYHVKSHGLDT